MLMLKNQNRDEELFMSKKIKNNCVIEFISKHKILFLCISICVAIVCSLPFVINNVGAEEKTADEVFVKKDSSMANSEANPYILDSVDDFILLQEFTKTNDCNGLYFEVGNTLKNNKLTYSEEEEDEEGSELGGVVYNLNLVGTLVLKDGSKTEFMGIGQNFRQPFRGNIMFSGITIRLDTPLFCFVASGASIEEVNVFGKIRPDKMNTFIGNNPTVGTLAGMAILDSAVKSLDISTVSVSNKTTVYGGAKPAGGLIGTVIADPRQQRTDFYISDTTKNKTNSSSMFNINLNGITVTDDVYVMSEGTGTNNYTSFSDLTKGNLHSNFTADCGGVIGTVTTTAQYVNVNFSGTTLVKGRAENTKNACGGVIGFIYSKTCVKFDGDVDVSGITALISNGTGNQAGNGYVIGSMYYETLAYITPGYSIKRPVNDELKKSNEVGLTSSSVSGQIFKNTNETLFDKNSAIIEGNGTDDSPYIIDSIDDMERLSAYLCSEGTFGSWYVEDLRDANNRGYESYDTWFNLPDTILYASKTNILNHIRSATYQISVDLDLSSRGIEKLNRRMAGAFQGSIIGLEGSYKDGNAYPTIEQNIDGYNQYVAFIPYAQGNRIAATDTTPAYSKSLVFKDFRFEGKVSGAYNVYGLIYDYSNNNSYYSGVKFDNIEMNVELEAKEANATSIAGFIGLAKNHTVTNDIDSDIVYDFTDIKFNGKLITNSSPSVGYGAGLIAYLYASGNNMKSVESDRHFLKVNINGYDFTSENVSSSSNNAMRIVSTIAYILHQNNVGTSSKTVAAIPVKIYNRPVVSMNDINIHDSNFINGESHTETMAGVLGYSWQYADIKINELNISNVKYDLNKGYGHFLITSVTGSFLEIDGLRYDNIKIYKEKGANENFTIGTLISNANDAVVTLKDYFVSNSTIYLEVSNYIRISETVMTNNTSNTTYGYHYRGLFSIEGNDKAGKTYDAVNTYDKQFKYTDLLGTEDYSSSLWTSQSGHVSYNAVSNMNGKYICGKGTKDDPFIIDDEAKLTLFSNAVSGNTSIEYYLKYYSDIEEILSDEDVLKDEEILSEADVNNLSWVDRYALFYKRIITGYYVFAKDMDLTYHSYYPAFNCTGNYYGFDAYEYSGNPSLTEDDLKMYASSAILALEDGISSNGINSEIAVLYKPEIHFAADKVAEGIRGITVASTANGTSPTATYGMHLKLHGGLFDTILGYKGANYQRGNVNISNIKLSGVASGRYLRGGSLLISGYGYSAIKNAKVNISNIDFQNAMIIQGSAVGTNSTTQADGLLIESIENSEVNITGVKILTDALGNANVRASALIGYQTGSSSKVILRDIDLNAVIDQGIIKAKDENNTEVYLPIEKVEFETTEKEGSFRSAPANTDESTMSDKEKEQLDAFNKYGYGFSYGYFYYYLEEGAAIYYYDVGNDIVAVGRTAETLGITEKKLSNDILLKQVQKYAYKTQNVDVNPVSANIIHGKGTKESPYIIDNLGQLITLSNFIRYKGDVIDYNSWYVGEINGTSYDATDSTTWADESNLIYRNRLESEDVDNRIKSVEYLSKAHYKITTDIDFSNPNDYFAQAAESFNGIGIEDYPFTGSIIGEVKEDGTIPKILLGSSSENYKKSFGIIQYAKGTKIADIDICAGNEYEENINIQTGAYLYVESEGVAKIYVSNQYSQVGILINNIIGGDNIIDNVGMNVNIQLDAIQGSTCYIGGYVGVMNNGTLTVGNLKKSTFENFIIKYIKKSNNGTVTYYENTYTSNNSKYTSSLLGLHRNGCIIIKDDSVDESKVYIDTSRVVTVEEIEEVVDGVNVKNTYNVVRVDDINYYNKCGIPFSLEYNPINYNYLEKMNTAGNRIKVIKDERDDSEKTGSLICQIKNADQLFLLSLMTGSGSISQAGSSTSVNVPYTKVASTWKYEEDFTQWLINENMGKDENSKTILNEDYDMPMFFKYFDFSALDNGYKDVYYNGDSMLSNGVVSTTRKDKTKRATWMLTNPDEDYVYDLSVYGLAFKGIGPMAESNFTWNDVTENPSLCFSANFDGNGKIVNVELSKSGITGLFSILNTGSSDNTAAHYEIGNFILQGSVNQTSTANVATGGVVGHLGRGYFDFKDITLAGLEISTLGAGGIGGIVGLISDQGIQVYYENINIGLPDEKTPDGTIAKDNSVFLDGTKTNSPINIGGLVSAVNTIKVNNVNINNSRFISKGNLGGISGYINLYNPNYESYINDITIKNTVVETTSSDDKGVGLLLGYSKTQNSSALTYPLAIHNVKTTDCKLIAPEGSVTGIVEGYHIYAAYREVLKFEYSNITDASGKEITALTDCRVENDTCTYIHHNEFYELEKAEELFGIDREALDSNGKLIAKYSECLETNMLSTIDADNDGEFDDIDLIPSTTDRVDNVMLKWSSDNGTMESVINSLLYSLTGGTGLLNDKNNARITVSVTPMQVKDGVASERTDDTEVLSIIKSGGNFVISNNNKTDTFEKDGMPATYSIVTISYTVVAESSATHTKFTETIEIPMFISNMINVDIYSKVKIGQEYDKDIMRAIQLTSKDAQITTKDSSYTVYTEYLYSANRIDFDEELYMNKGFRLYDAPSPWIWEGTKLTLIDLTFEDAPKTYYYDVKEKMEFVPLSYFTDEEGHNYKERNINNISELPVTNAFSTMYVNGRTFNKYDRGVEKYLLFVDCTKAQIPADANDSNLSPFIIDGVPNGQTEIINKDVFYVKYRTYNTLSTFTGRKIEFVDDSLVTEGEINKEKQLTVKVDYSDTASDYYWSDIKQYDYNNQGKYLEVAVYLKNDKDEKVMLPSGTRIMYPGSSAVYESVKNTSAIFYYKDGVKKEGYALMDKTENTIENIEFTLDFTYAKMDKIPSGQYKICFDLVRNSNKDFPMGDDIIDTIESTGISVTSGAEYGFRLDTNGKDALAFNLADIIEGQVLEVDFGVMLNSTLPVSIAENKKATVKFVLYKKDEVTGNYVEYKDLSDLELTDIELEIFYNNVIENVKLDEGDYEYVFNGISGKEEEAVEASCKLRFPYNADINNYKLQAEMYIDGYKQASDYFVVNISDITH
ncbi:MAG: hypothetical protein IJA34_12430 [Lachnospiraceae bacterium]|nr:hypothetical protein [Lachnospiraceae bacterium]